MSLSDILIQLLKGMGISVYIFAVTLIFSLPLGLLTAFGRMNKNIIVSSVFKLYISIMRGTPLNTPAAGSVFWTLLYCRD